MQNDEIKEILDKLKDGDWYDELDLTGDKWIELKQTEINKILDYITNLQQENERLKENNSYMQEEMGRTWKKCDDYKSRCEKAIEYINDKKIYDEEYGEFIYYNYLIHDRLLNILQNGSEK